MPRIVAKDIMTSDVKAVGERTPIKEVAELLAENSISGAPVVDESGRLIGMVTEADLINMGKLEKKLESALPRTALFGLWVVPERLLEDARHHSLKLTAKDVMTHPVITAGEDATVQELADLIVKNKINRIPILKDGQLAGIVTRHDILLGMQKASEDNS